MRTTQKIIGVLGAGQLALFLSLKAQSLGLKLITFSANREDPVALKSTSLNQTATKSIKNKSKSTEVTVAPLQWIYGSPLQAKALKSFLNRIDILTFESELFSADHIKECKKKTRVHPSLKNEGSIQRKTKRCRSRRLVHPSLKNLGSIQDRLLQKKLLARYDFPILAFKAWDHLKRSKNKLVQNSKQKTERMILHNPFINVPDKKQRVFVRSSKDPSLFPTKNSQNTSFKEKGCPLKEWEELLNIGKNWGSFVLKTRRGGYDGYGTFVVKNRADLLKLFSVSPQSSKIKKQSKDFLSKNSFIIEPLLNFKRELALLSARNQKGQIIFFPLVESFQENSVCLWVKGPVKHPKLAELKRKISHFLTKIDYRGVIAFELFETECDLIVNELAPRVHNTGHYSLDALTEDQFTVHLKAISNQDLKTPQLLSKEFAMLNLLGEGYSQPLLKTQPLIEQNQKLKKKGFHLYWYGKKESRPGRKMGHINCVGSQALQKLLKLKKQLKI